MLSPSEVLVSELLRVATFTELPGHDPTNPGAVVALGDLLGSYSGYVDQPFFRPKQISRSGHADHQSEATFGRPVWLSLLACGSSLLKPFFVFRMDGPPSLVR